MNCAPVSGSPGPNHRRHAAGTHQNNLHVAAAGVGDRHGNGHVLQGLHPGLFQVIGRN